MKMTSRFLGEWVEHQAGETLVAERLWEPRSEPVLYEHALGHVGFPENAAVLERERRGWLPVLPLTFMMEAAAEAAQVLLEKSRVVGFVGLKSRAYVVLSDQRPTCVRLRAQRLTHDTVKVSVTLPRSKDAEGVVFEVNVQLTETEPALVISAPSPLTSPEKSPSTVRELYDEVFFHGPSFQRIHSLLQLGEDGLDACVSIHPDRHQTVVDPFLLDVVSQLINFWAHERIDTRSWGAFFAADHIRWNRSMFSADATQLAHVSVRIRRLGPVLLQAEAVFAEETSRRRWISYQGVLNLWQPAPRQFLKLVRGGKDASVGEELVMPDPRFTVFVSRALDEAPNNAHAFLGRQLLLHPEERRLDIPPTLAGALSKDVVRTVGRRQSGHRWSLFEISLASSLPVDPPELRGLLDEGILRSSGDDAFAVAAFAQVPRPQWGGARLGLAWMALAATPDDTEGWVNVARRCLSDSLEDVQGCDDCPVDLPYEHWARVRVRGALAQRFPQLEGKSAWVMLTAWKEMQIGVFAGFFDSPPSMG